MINTDLKHLLNPAMANKRYYLNDIVFAEDTDTLYFMYGQKNESKAQSMTGQKLYDFYSFRPYREHNVSLIFAADNIKIDL